MFYKIPKYIEIKNKKYKINSDYLIFVNLEIMIEEGKDINEAIKTTLLKFYPLFFEIVEDGVVEEALQEMINFYRLNKKDKPKPKQNKTKNKNERITSYKEDAYLIWGAFKLYYNIDLNKNRVHWWEFRSMLDNIPQDAEYSKIKGYRAYNGTDKDLLELKEFYKLPPSQLELNEIKRKNQLFEELQKYEKR